MRRQPKRSHAKLPKWAAQRIEMLERQHHEDRAQLLRMTDRTETGSNTALYTLAMDDDEAPGMVRRGLPHGATVAFRVNGHGTFDRKDHPTWIHAEVKDGALEIWWHDDAGIGLADSHLMILPKVSNVIRVSVGPRR